MRGVFTPDVTLDRQARTKARPGSVPIVYLPEPASPPPWSSPNPIDATERRHAMQREARAAFGIGDDRRVVLVFGVIGERKGVEQLLAATRTSSWPSDVDVLVVGAVSAGVRSRLGDVLERHADSAHRSGCQWYVVDGHASSMQEHLAYAASDVVWVGYVGHPFSSAVMMRAAFERVPVVACDVGLIGKTAVEERLGWTVDVHDPTGVARVVSEAVRRPWLADRALLPATEERRLERVKATFADTVEAWMGVRRSDRRSTADAVDGATGGRT